MKKALLALAVVAFVVAGAAQPAMAQQEEDMRQPDLEINETEEDENETEIDEVNETEEDEREEAEGRSAQFDARLGVAIDTVSTLVEIAPNDEARTGLENALDQLREVQNQTDTASLGPEDRPDEAENESEEEESENESSEDSGQQGPPEDRGPSQNSNRPGFVNQMLGGIFG